MTLPILAKKVKKLASFQLFNLKLLLNGESNGPFFVSSDCPDNTRVFTEKSTSSRLESELDFYAIADISLFFSKDDRNHRVAYNQGLMPTRFPVVAKITAKEKNEKAIMEKVDHCAYRPLPDSQTLTNNMYLGAITKSGGKTDRNTFGRYGNADSLKGKATLDRAGFGHSYGGRNSYWSGLPEENIGGQGTSGDSQGYFYSGKQDYNQDNGYWLSHLDGKYSNTAYGSSPTTLNEDYSIKPSGKYLGPIDSNKYYGYKIISKSIPGYGNFQGFGITDHNGLRNGGGSSYSNKEIQNGYGTSDSYLTQGQGILQSQHKGDEFSSIYDRKVYANSKVGTFESSLLDPEFHGNSGVYYGTRETYNAGLSPGKYGTHETFSHTPQGYQNEGYNEDEPSGSIYGRNHEIFSTNQNHPTKYGAQIVKNAYPEHGSIANIGGELGVDQQNIVHTSLNLEQD
uniref:Rhoptry neck protein 2 n=1 Tax=Heterorhabditis bacteriophora TaxID=37862 RepID=A0A1I7X190_HETBA